ncbi:MAG: GNAT family N-acetyltransferase [Bacteroidia bacterium]
MEIKTERLKLREASLSDLEKVQELNSLPETDKYNTLGIPGSIDQTKELMLPWIDSQRDEPRKKFVLCIENKEKEFVGLIGINLGEHKYSRAEIWYKILPQFWNKGYASEVVNSVLSFCFTELKLHRVEAGCATENIASARVLEKCGFTKEGLCRKILPIRGQWVDNYEYAILEEDYFTN